MAMFYVKKGQISQIIGNGGDIYTNIAKIYLSYTYLHLCLKSISISISASIFISTYISISER